MLRQAFLNLALNACQAMPNGGSLAIKCVGSRRQRVSIVFTDTGVGIQPEHLNRIFDLYFTTGVTAALASGFRWSIARSQMHDGEIEVRVNTREGHDVYGLST